MLTLERKMRRALYKLSHSATPSVSLPGNHSQHGQDRFIADSLFKGKRGGVFVDVGAYDGKTYSNTLYLERELGWTGLAVEPQPSAFAELAASRSCIVSNCCVADYTCETSFVAHEGYSAMFSGMPDEYGDFHRARIEGDQRRYGGLQQTITVKCKRLPDLLSEVGIDHVDYLSLDTEGSEYTILRTIDFDKLHINVISVENNYGSHKFQRLLTKSGYQLVALAGPDEIYMKRSRK